jgi:hypothetical protein
LPVRVPVTGPPRTAPYDEYITPSCSGGEYNFIYAGDMSEVMDAAGFGNPSSVQINTANYGANQNWCAEPLKDGYVAIFAHYATSGKGARTTCA